MSAAASTVETPVALPARVVREGMHTPWGNAQTVINLCPGLGWVSTASHGGYRVCSQLNEKIPDYVRCEDGWYEEDCAASIVEVFFEQMLLECSNSHFRDIIQSGSHKETFRHWYPDAYEEFYGVTLQPGESCVKDERLFHEEHKNDLIAVAAWGDWHERVPEGMVGVAARVGGRGSTVYPPERYFLVPKEEYDAGSRFGFIVDTARHQEIEAF
jgi:hypothetical protein